LWGSVTFVEPDKSLLARSGNLYRVQIAVSPLLPREMPSVIEAFTKQWAKPEDVERAKNAEAGVLIASAEGHLRLGEKPDDIARNVTYAIWKTLDRYVKVTVEAVYLGDPPSSSFEFGEKAYAEAFGARFES
jgi:hypothetical protein